jgi:anti-sigma regulatory factor (Ser/Thr protein kinase)
MTDIDADGWRHAKICATCHGWGQVQRTRGGSSYRPAPFWIESGAPAKPVPGTHLDDLWLGVVAAMDPSYRGWTTGDRPRVAWLALPAKPPAVRDFRGFLRDTLTTWDLDEVSDDASTVVSELVTNALQHGSKPLPDGATMPIDLIMSSGNHHLMTVVTDPGRPVLPGRFNPSEFKLLLPGAESAITRPDSHAETGRGLLIVDTLADSWGWARLPGGRTAVWAIFHRP